MSARATLLQPARSTRWAEPLLVAVSLVCLTACDPVGSGPPPAKSIPGPRTSSIDLGQAFDAHKLRAGEWSFLRHVLGNPIRRVTKIHPSAVRLSAESGSGVAWVEGTDFASGTIELDIRGKDVQDGSFVGVAFHRKDDNAYEAVYLRPFNFRTADLPRRHHAVQYIKLPEYDFDRLRRESPEEFESAVDGSLVPTDWIHVRVVAQGSTVQVFVGPVAQPTLQVRKVGSLHDGEVGLWVGSGSGGDFANLVVGE